MPETRSSKKRKIVGGITKTNKDTLIFDDNILNCIFLLLPCTSILVLTVVCKRFYHLLKQASFWRTYSLNFLHLQHIESKKVPDYVFANWANVLQIVNTMKACRLFKKFLMLKDVVTETGDKSSIHSKFKVSIVQMEDHFNRGWLKLRILQISSGVSINVSYYDNEVLHALFTYLMIGESHFGVLKNSSVAERIEVSYEFACNPTRAIQLEKDNPIKIFTHLYESCKNFGNVGRKVISLRSYQTPVLGTISEDFAMCNNRGLSLDREYPQLYLKTDKNNNVTLSSNIHDILAEHGFDKRVNFGISKTVLSAMFVFGHYRPDFRSSWDDKIKCWFDYQEMCDAYSNDIDDDEVAYGCREDDSEFLKALIEKHIVRCNI